MQESIVFLVRVQYRRKESSRSLSHLLMSFLSITVTLTSDKTERIKYQSHLLLHNYVYTLHLHFLLTGLWHPFPVILLRLIVLSVDLSVFSSVLSFWHPNSNLQDARETPRQKYIRGLFLCQTRKIYSDIEPTFSLILRREVKKWEIGPKFGLWDDSISKRRKISEIENKLWKRRWRFCLPKTSFVVWSPPL